MNYTAAIERLAQYRREHFLTIPALADEMRAAGCPIPARSLHLALTHRLKTQPRETTRWKIEEFVEALERKRKKTGARKARRRPAA